MSRSDDDDDYFGDPVKLIHTHEEKTFITDGRFLDAEIIDLGEILSSEEEPECNAPQKTRVLVLGSKQSKDSKTNSIAEIVNKVNSESQNKKNKNNKKNLILLTHKLEIQKAIEQKNIVKTDIRKNTGLIGIKIERQTDQSLKQTFENESNTIDKPQNICITAKNTKKSKIKCSDKTEIPKKSDQSSKSTHKLEKLSKSTRNTNKEKTKKKETFNGKTVENNKDNKNKISVKTPMENNLKEKDKTSDTGLCNFNEAPTDQSNKNTKVVTQRSFPNINKFTKCVLKKVLKGAKIRPITTPVKKIKEDKQIKSNIKVNNILPGKEDIPQNCKDVQSVIKKRSVSKTNDNNDLKSIKSESCPKFIHSHKQDVNLRLESSLKGDQNLIDNNLNIPLNNYSSSSLATSIEMNAKIASIARLQYPFPSNPCNTSSISPETNSQLHHNAKKIESTQLLDHNENWTSQEQPFPVGLHSVAYGDTVDPRNNIGFQYNRPPPELQNNKKVDMVKLPPNVYGNEQTFSCERQRFPDDRLINKTSIQPHNMIMYRSPPPYANSSYRYHYPETVSSIPDNSRRYTFNNQNYGCRFVPYTLPYHSEIFAHPPPPLPPPPPPAFPPVSQQQLQQRFVHISPQPTQNSCIGSNNDGIIKKINIPAQLSVKPGLSIPDVNRKDGIVKLENFEDKTKQDSKNVNKTVATKPAFTKSEMLKELTSPENVNKTVTITPAVTKFDLLKKLNSPKNVNKTTACLPAVTKTEMLNELNGDVQPDNFTVYIHGPKNDLKRPLTSLFPIRKENHYHKPCPLSKKAIFGEMLPNKEEINKKHIVNKGYSPPILPIPTFENILSETRAFELGSMPYTTEKKTGDKNVAYRSRYYQDHNTALRKISLDEYKKKSYQ